MILRTPQFAVRAGSLAMIALVAALAGSRPGGADPSSASTTLRNAAEFSSISNQADRSRALFEEIGKVLTNPRCMNCHPAGDHPLQGDDSHEHVPPIWRGETGHLEVSCSGCHSGKNFPLHEAATYRSIPGHPRWGFAPLSMAWEGKSLGDICRQLKDVQRNGGRDLAALQEHIAKDDLVAWGWNPGEGRKPAPGSQKAAGELVQAWIDSGAECPR
ncbi:Isoquinoline 1-oxidoreductase subunit [Bradyrhizobium cosmicum]|uniref:Isoquinoline 1-oxidoreductase subunit n=1 Tax=Bradyrhizobium cosmicum TaxID=1404864 RepID=UPI0011633A1F|nr:Isoquinoline 1-oxidoreductase subunit [Bradyrhizobium cosmicum]QDP24496.1 Isoquinoline 1-oxidoreductase subunit [Bradyrhizobium cosmicum]